MKRLLYVMHVDWNWIRQRPQEIAAGLNDSGYLVQVLHVPNYQGTAPRALDTEPAIRKTALWAFPLRRFSLVRRVNATLQRLQVRLRIMRFKPDIIWVTAPHIVSLIPRDAAPLVYDCMDLAEGFATDAGSINETRQTEADARGRASLILTSSANLQQQIRNSSGHDAVLVRNACPTGTELARDDTPRDETRCNLLYVGTISHWFDFELCRQALSEIPGLEIHIAGPAEIDVPDVPGLVHLGIKARSSLPELASHYAGLLMPFVLSDLIRAVDPVKLYEYISFRRPILAVGYSELDHFGDMIHRYQSDSEFVGLVREVLAGRVELPPRERVDAFLRANTWQSRVHEIVACLDQLSAET